jgi:hypothetical protein
MAWVLVDEVEGSMDLLFESVCEDIFDDSVV